VARIIVSEGIPLYLQPDFYPKSTAEWRIAGYNHALLEEGLRLCHASEGSSLLKVVVASDQPCLLSPTGEDS
jgi:hypothetical protein